MLTSRQIVQAKRKRNKGGELYIVEPVSLHDEAMDLDRNSKLSDVSVLVTFDQMQGTNPTSIRLKI